MVTARSGNNGDGPRHPRWHESERGRAVARLLGRFGPGPKSQAGSAGDAHPRARFSRSPLGRAPLRCRPRPRAGPVVAIRPSAEPQRPHRGRCGSTFGRPWPAGDSRPRSRRGPRVKPFTPDPSGPSDLTHLPQRRPPLNDQCAEGPDGSGRAADLTLGGGSAQYAPPSPRPNHCTTITPCRAPTARRARGAERERALAGCSGGASGPCRPGLKPYRKFSPTVARLQCPTATAGVRCRYPGTGSPLPLLTTQRIRPHRDTRVQSPARRLQRVTNIGDPVPPLISHCLRPRRGPLPAAHRHGGVAGSRVFAHRVRCSTIRAGL
jgi:hypothetical protein